MRRLQSQAEEIDFIVYSSREKKGVLFEIKWKELSYENAKNIILRKSLLVKINQKRYGIVAKRILKKEKLREEGYVALGLEGITSK